MRPIAIERARTARTVLREIRCGLGPNDQPYPERHRGWCIALVRRGAFAYRAADASRARDLRAGWLLLGRDEAEYECAHPSVCGDECLAIDLADSLLEDVRSAMRLPGSVPFPLSVLPPIPRVVGALATAEHALSAGDEPDLDALAASVIEAVLEACGAQRPAMREPSARDRERVAAALDAIDARPEESWTLAELASLVGASPFHFARAFRAIVGSTPHRYLIAARLRRAAFLLLETRRRVTDVAYDVGFADLSNFMHTFRREMGVTPRSFRARGKLLCDRAP